MTVQAFMMPIVYLDFKLRQDYIAKVLCINRDKPEMHCNGRCILMQKMKKAQQKEQSPQNQHSKSEILWLHCAGLLQLDFQVNLPVILEHHPFKSDFYSYTLLRSLFHPPQFSYPLQA